MPANLLEMFEVVLAPVFESSPCPPHHQHLPVDHVLQRCVVHPDGTGDLKNMPIVGAVPRSLFFYLGNPRLLIWKQWQRGIESEYRNCLSDSLLGHFKVIPLGTSGNALSIH